MSSRKRHDKPVLAIQSQLAAEIAGAKELVQPSRGRVEPHGARKRLKRARALLRLLREALGEEAYRALNIRLRDIARPLSAARDTEVLFETVQNLSRGEPALARGLSGLRRSLRSALRQQHATAKRRSAGLVGRAERIRKNVLSVEAVNTGWQPIAAALERIYRHSRRELRRSQACGTAAALHEWRKQVKHHFYQLEALARITGNAQHNKLARLEKLGDLLGDDHDLFVLRSRLARNEDDLDVALRVELIERIDRKRRKLERIAFALGRRIYGHKPRRVARELTH